MSKWKKTGLMIIFLEIVLILLSNFLYLRHVNDSGDRLYRVEAERVAERLRELNGRSGGEQESDNEQQGSVAVDIDLSDFSTIIAVSEFHGETCNNDYVLEKVNGTWYRIEYQAYPNQHGIIFFNLALFAMLFLTLFVFYYVYRKILLPFDSMQQLPLELAKGNLAVPIREEKGKFFGRFLWGMDMLRENLEEKRQKELELQRERKTLILSLSHDIKSPLSAIDLYTRALAEDLYGSEEKRQKALQGIIKNTQEIKSYVEEITKASREDFLNLEVQDGEFYLREAISFIQKYYQDKLAVRHTEFRIETVRDCLLKGNRDRLIEVLQNLMENAVKYGDGDRIAISFGEEEDCKLITVENTGSTPGEEELPHLFDSFYRGSNHKNVKGSGLGLYICRNLMKKMDGEVFAKIERNVFRVTVVVRKA